MSHTQRTKIQALLSVEASPLRDELAQLGFDAIVSQPLSVLLADPGLVSLIYTGLTRDVARTIAGRHVLPGIARVDATLATQKDRLRDLLSQRAQTELAAIVASGKGPRFKWLRGAVDPGDLSQLVGPVVQQVLIQFATRLPIPGFSPAGGGGGSGAGGIGGLVGMIGKQVSRSAGQLADVGKSVMGGIGSEIERRMQQMARDFSQTAVSQFNTALAERMKSPEGRAIVARMRDRILEHVLEAKATVVVKDFLHLPVQDIADLVASIIDHSREQPLIRALIEAEVRAVLDELGTRPLGEVLSELGLLAEARALTLNAVSPGLKALVASDAFGAWLERLLEQASEP